MTSYQDGNPLQGTRIMSDDDQGSGEQDEAAETASDVAEGVGKLADTASKAASGDVAGAVASGAGALGSVGDIAGGALGEEEGEAREALNTASTVANTASAAVGAIGGLAGAAQSGNLSQAAGGLGSATDAARYIVPDNEARSVLEGVGTGARALGGAANALGGGGSPGGEPGASAGQGGGQRDPVAFHLEVHGASEPWAVNRVTLSERLNSVPTCFIEARYQGALEASELLHSEVVLFMERSEHRREFKGIVWHAQVDEHAHADEVVVHLDVSPRAALLGTRQTRKLFQDKTIVEVIEEVYTNLLGSLQQTVDTEGLQRTYETREYIVQYDETDLAFIGRLCEEEGIFWFFDHEPDQPVLHLADSVSGLATVHADGGKVEFCEREGDTPDVNTVWDVHHVEEINSTDVFLRGYDWTNPSLDVEGDATGRSDIDPPREVYDPRTHALLYHQFGGTQYGGNTAKMQAQLRAERLDLNRKQWSMSTSVVGARPGTTIELSGAPDADYDQRYLIVSVHADGAATEGVEGTWENTLEVVPVSMPYRPQRETPRPRTGGPTTAIVVGPSGSEIHTDEHGRVRVRFHWDRDHERGDEFSSCWMRVSQSWAGPGFGTFFLPRVGMEVVVSFLEGDPDRPLVTGCVYHGENRASAELPGDKTQSYVRTKSSPNSEGYNEIRFEDASGSEFIFIHAQKDLNEVVEHNHSTHVKNNQSNSVDVDQTETIGGKQTMTVDKNRTVHVKGSQSFTIDGGEANDGVTGSKLEITGDYKVDVSDWIEIEAPTHIQIKCGESIFRMEPGKITLTAGDGSEIVLDANARTTSSAGTETLLDADARTTASTGSELKLDANADLHSNDGSQVLLNADATMTSSKGATVALSADADMSGMGATVTGSQHADVSAPTATLAGAAGSVEAGAAGVDVGGPQVNITGQSMVNVSGSVVKIN